MTAKPTPAPDLATLHDLARRRAERLRQEALTAFWRDLEAALAVRADRLGRATRRLAQRLRQHRRPPAAPAQSPSNTGRCLAAKAV